MTKGKLILIPATLGDNEPAVTLPAAVFQHIDKLNYFVVENTRTARRFLRKCGYKKDFEEVFFTELNEHTPPAEVEAMIKPALEGFDLGIISEAGLPCVADPGSRLVRIAHQVFLLRSAIAVLFLCFSRYPLFSAFLRIHPPVLSRQRCPLRPECKHGRS